MSKNNEYIFLIFLVFATLLPKWIISWVYFDNSILVDTIFNLKDITYFPIVISFSEFIFNPSYLDQFNENKLLTFPIYSIIIHSILFKIANIYSFIILEFVFQFIFLLVLFIMIQKIFVNLNHSIYFCISIFLIISFLQISLILDHSKYLELLFNSLDENFGSRFPRPLFTGIIYFYFFYVLYSFREKLEKFDLKYFIILVFFLSIFLNSFFYYFINFSLLLILLIFRYLKISIFEFLYKQKKKIFLIILSFILLSFPFLFQLYFGENDYSERLGVISIDYKQKIYLLKYYFFNLLRPESLLLLTMCFLIHYFISKTYDRLRDQISNINLFFYFILVSIFAPPIFFIFSPNIISISHFLGILLFSLIFYLIISLNFILGNKILFNYSFILRLALIFFLFISNTYIAKKKYDRDNLVIEETQKIQNYLQNQKLINTKKKLFTNDLNIMNLWLLNKNTELVISDGFINSLTNKDIEFNLINNLKNFEISKDELKNILSFGKSEIRNDFLMRLYTYRYQANSIYTYSKLDNYSTDMRSKIINTSPFRVQQQIMPEDEKERLILLFEKIKLNKKMFSDIVIINKKISLSNFKVYNKKYILAYSTNLYDIYILK